MLTANNTVCPSSHFALGQWDSVTVGQWDYHRMGLAKPRKPYQQKATIVAQANVHVEGPSHPWIAMIGF